MEVCHSFKVMTYDIDFAGVVSNQVSRQFGAFVSTKTGRPVPLPAEYKVRS